MSTTKALSVPALGGEQSLNRYLAEIKKFPVLTAEQEYMLAKRYAEHEDPEAAAQLVASSISGAVIMAFDPTQVTSGAQVTVVTGTQFSVNPPAAGGTAATVGTPGPTTTSTTSSGAFQAPSAAVTPLQPWDPRSCTASGGEGP